MNELTRVLAAEAALTDNVRSATEALRQVGAGSLPSALADLKDAAQGAAGRLEAARAYLACVVGDLAALLEGLAGEVAADLAGAPEPAPETAAADVPPLATVASGLAPEPAPAAEYELNPRWQADEPITEDVPAAPEPVAVGPEPGSNGHAPRGRRRRGH